MNCQKDDRGFTLVELMVVVAIVAVLAVVAVPNLLQYQAKSKVAEAKLNLAAMYTSLQSFYSEYDSYASCLSQMGYDPTAENDQRYYASGFTGEVATTRAFVNGRGADCSTMALGISHYVANKRTGGYLATDLTYLPTSVVAQDTFTAGASGILNRDYNTQALADKWTIDQDKRVEHVHTGY